MLRKAFVLTAAVALAAGCSSSPRSGTVAGHLYAVGGPAPGSPRPLNGSVVANGPGGTHRVDVGADGRFQMSLAPGVYTLTGTSPLYESGNALCRAVAKVRVTTGKIASADVLCQER